MCQGYRDPLLSFNKCADALGKLFAYFFSRDEGRCKVVLLIVEYRTKELERVSCLNFYNSYRNTVIFK